VTADALESHLARAEAGDSDHTDGPADSHSDFADEHSDFADGHSDFDQVYRRHAPRCLHVAMRVTNDHQHAQDAVQEAFLSYSRDRCRFDPARGNIGTWLAMLTHRRAVDVVRREAARPKLAAQPDAVIRHLDAAADPEERAAASIRSGEVQDVVRTLDETKRQIIFMAYYLGYTQTQIAAATGTPLGTVKTRNRDALRELRVGLVRAGDRDAASDRGPAPIGPGRA
jgi:RNA polymerase sigma-70 factor, ECF subfamily